MRETYGGEITDEQIERLAEMDKTRDKLLERYMKASKHLGEVESDDPAEDLTLSGAHARYIKELDERRKSGQPIGRPSALAIQLAERANMKSIFRFDETQQVVDDETRQEVVDEFRHDIKMAGEKK